MRGWLWVGLGIFLATVAVGCTKRVPIETDQLDPRRHLVLSFTDGSQVRGSFAADATVEVLSGGAVYRGTIWELTETEIVVRGARFIRRLGDLSAQRARLEHARYDLGVERAEFTFRRDEISGVEEVRVDALRTASQAVMWAVTGTVSAFLLSEKS